jgi:hypothetical protein
LAPTAKPLAPIGGLPTTFDFTDEPSGPFPGPWEFYRLQHPASGNVNFQVEPQPTLYYKIVDGVGFWVYTRNPLGGVIFNERGVAASPSGILVGRNARVAVILRSPAVLLGDKTDSFFYEVTLGLRFDADQSAFVGGRARAQWAGGVWTEPLALEAVQATNKQDPVVLASATIEPEPDPVDHWRANDRMELEVVVRDTTMDVALNGVWRTSATIPADGPAKPILIIRVYNRFGALIAPVATLLAFQLQSLRDFSKLGPPPQLPGDVALEGIGILPTLRAPLPELLELGLLKRVGSRRFEALDDIEAVVGSQSWMVRKGEVLHAREPFVGQALVPVTRDLAHERGRGGL